MSVAYSFIFSTGKMFELHVNIKFCIKLSIEVKTLKKSCEWYKNFENRKYPSERYGRSSQHLKKNRVRQFGKSEIFQD